MILAKCATCSSSLSHSTQYVRSNFCASTIEHNRSFATFPSSLGIEALSFQWRACGWYAMHTMPLTAGRACRMNGLRLSRYFLSLVAYGNLPLRSPS